MDTRDDIDFLLSFMGEIEATLKGFKSSPPKDPNHIHYDFLQYLGEGGTYDKKQFLQYLRKLDRRRLAYEKEKLRRALEKSIRDARDREKMRTQMTGWKFMNKATREIAGRLDQFGIRNTETNEVFFEYLSEGGKPNMRLFTRWLWKWVDEQTDNYKTPWWEMESSGEYEEDERYE